MFVINFLKIFTAYEMAFAKYNDNMCWESIRINYPKQIIMIWIEKL